MCLYFLHIIRWQVSFRLLQIIKMTEKENLGQNQTNGTISKNLEWENLGTGEKSLSMDRIWDLVNRELEDVVETKKVEKLYYVGLKRRNPNHGTIGYIDLVAATHDVAFPKKYSWDYDYDVRLSIKIEHEDSNKIKLTCWWKSIVVDIGYFERKPETIGKEHINKILNVLWYEI